MRADREPFVLGDWRVDPGTGELQRGAQRARLEPRVMEVLLFLVQARGRVVSKEELFASVWEGSAVTDDVLRRCIYNLRSTLGDDTDQPRYIRTLPRRGYQVVAEVGSAREGAAAPRDLSVEVPAAVAIAAHHRVHVRRRGRRLTAAALLIVAVAAAVALRAGSRTEHAALAATRGGPLLAEDGPAPTTADDYLQLGMRYVEQRGPEDFERAIEMFNKSLELEPDAARTHAELANAYALTVRGYFRDPARFDLAIEHATLALGLDPDMVEANKALGIAFAGKGWLGSAVREYERALEKRPDYQAVLNNLAIVELARGRVPRALGLLRQLDNGLSTRALHLNNLGYAYRLLGDYTEARRVLGRSQEIMPDNALAATNLAIVELADGDPLAARSHIRRALPLYGNDAPFLATAGLIELAAGDAARAERLFADSARLSADGTNNHAYLGLAYLHLGRDADRAAHDIFTAFYDYADESRRLRREHWAPHYNLTAIYAMLGRVDEALIELGRAIELGFVDYGVLDAYPFFEHLQGDPRYRTIVSDLRARVANMRHEAYRADTH